MGHTTIVAILIFVVFFFGIGGTVYNNGAYRTPGLGIGAFAALLLALDAFHVIHL